jgi:hypothetical protein
MFCDLALEFQIRRLGLVHFLKYQQQEFLREEKFVLKVVLVLALEMLADRAIALRQKR